MDETSFRSATPCLDRNGVQTIMFKDSSGGKSLVADMLEQGDTDISLLFRSLLFLWYGKA